MLSKTKSFIGNKGINKKIFISLLSLTALFFVFAGSANAASSVSVRLQQPASQIGTDTFDLTFVALDIQGRPVSVQCYKQGPSDSGFVAFGPVISLLNGGNTDKCHVGSGEVNQSGHTYQFEAIATAGGADTATSNVVSMDYNNDTPGTPESYTKTKPDNCTYRINFHTANDSGKTVQVVLYRSTNQSFSLDSGTKVNSINIGSNTDGHLDDNISPNCNTNYYYAIKAFTVYGVASGATGDNSNQTVTTNPTGTPSEGAISVVQLAGAKQQVLGQATNSATNAKPTPALSNPNPVVSSSNWILTHKTISLMVLLLLIGVCYYLYQKNKKK